MDKWIRKCPDWVAWENGLNIDGDGAPNCYGPHGGLDYLANAGGPGDWYGVVTDAQGNPVVQGPEDPYPGMYVSPTALRDHDRPATDPRAYVNSDEVPYISVPRNAIKDYGVKLGDVGFVYCRATGQFSPVIVADVGPRNKWGEGSMALARALGLPSSPRNGGTGAGVVCCVFTRTGRGWPRTLSDVASQVQARLNELGGSDLYMDIIQPQS